jgi:hypothetical protein
MVPAMRRVLLALAVLLGLLAPVAAQAPPPVPALPDAPRLTSYNLSASTCACSVGFAIYGDGTDVDAWIAVTINGVERLSTDTTYGWTITSATGPLGSIPRPITDAVLTFANPQTGTVVISGDRRPRRLSQFSEGAGVTARQLNQVITDIVATQRELWDGLNGALRGQPGEVFAPLPPAATRADTLLGFDAMGNPMLYPAGGGGSSNALLCNITNQPLGECINTSQASPGGSISMPTNLNVISINENVQVSGSNTFLDGLAITQNAFGGYGGRQTLQVQLQLSGWQATATGGGINGFAMALTPDTIVTANAGGTSSGTGYGVAGVLGPELVLQPGATFYNEALVQENDLQIATGASAYFATGMKITHLNAHTQHALIEEGALVFTDQPNATVGWNTLILIGGFNGGSSPFTHTAGDTPAVSHGTIMGLSNKPGFQFGIDLTNANPAGTDLTSGAPFRSGVNGVNGGVSFAVDWNGVAAVSKLDGIGFANGAVTPYLALNAPGETGSTIDLGNNSDPTVYIKSSKFAVCAFASCTTTFGDYNVTTTGVWTFNTAVNFTGADIAVGRIYGGAAAGSSLVLTSTSAASPSGDLVAMQGSKLYFEGPSGAPIFADYNGTIGNVWGFNAVINMRGNAIYGGTTANNTFFLYATNAGSPSGDSVSLIGSILGFQTHTGLVGDYAYNVAGRWTFSAPTGIQTAALVDTNTFIVNGVLEITGTGGTSLALNRYYSSGWKATQTGVTGLINLVSASPSSIEFYLSNSTTQGAAITDAVPLTLYESGAVALGGTAAYAGGTPFADYGLTSAGAWTFSAPMVVSSPGTINLHLVQTGATDWLFGNGPTNAIRLYDGTSYGVIEGVNPANTMYRPIALGGLSIVFTASSAQVGDYAYTVPGWWSFQGSGAKFTGGVVQVTGNSVPAAGAGIELSYSTTGNITAYDRTGAAYKPLVLNALNVGIDASGTAIANFASGLISWATSLTSGSHGNATFRLYDTGTANTSWGFDVSFNSLDLVSGGNNYGFYGSGNVLLGDFGITQSGANGNGWTFTSNSALAYNAFLFTVTGVNPGFPNTLQMQNSAATFPSGTVAQFQARITNLAGGAAFLQADAFNLIGKLNTGTGLTNGLQLIAGAGPIHMDGATNVILTVAGAALPATAAANALCYTTAGSTFIVTYQAWTTGCASSAVFYKDLYASRDLNIAGLVDLRTETPWSYRRDTSLYEQGKVHVGLLADDVEKLDARCVSYGEHGVENYEDRCLIAYLVEGYKRLKADNDNLRTELEQRRAAR